MATAVWGVHNVGAVQDGVELRCRCHADTAGRKPVGDAGQRRQFRPQLLAATVPDEFNPVIVSESLGDVLRSTDVEVGAVLELPAEMLESRGHFCCCGLHGIKRRARRRWLRAEPILIPRHQPVGFPDQSPGAGGGLTGAGPGIGGPGILIAARRRNLRPGQSCCCCPHRCCARRN